MSTVTQDTLFELPEAEVCPLNGWQARIEKFNEMSEARGGLIPRSVLADTLGVSRQRVAELIDKGQLEKISFFGTHFVSGRSIREHLQGEKAKGGRGRKHNLGTWQALKVGARWGADLAGAIVD